MTNQAINKKIIIYDGYCTMCNSSVSFIQSADKSRKFDFLSRYCDEAKKYNATEVDSIILVVDDLVYYKSQAVLKIASELGYPYKIANIFNLFPNTWLNAIYDFVARNRSMWFKSKTTCTLHLE